jgi:hypothetical protein
MDETDRQGAHFAIFAIVGFNHPVSLQRHKPFKLTTDHYNQPINSKDVLAFKLATGHCLSLLLPSPATSISDSRYAGF